jgi:hypothetical protein
MFTFRSDRIELKIFVLKRQFGTKKKERLDRIEIKNALAVSQLGWLKVRFLIVVNMEFKYFTSEIF